MGGNYEQVNKESEEVVIKVMIDFKDTLAATSLPQIHIDTPAVEDKEKKMKQLQFLWTPQMTRQQRERLKMMLW